MNRLPPGSDRAEVLVEIALQLGATPDLDRLLPYVLRRVTELLQADRAVFALVDSRHNVTRAVVHNLEWVGLPSPLPISSSLVYEALTSGKTLKHVRGDDFTPSVSMMNLDLSFTLVIPVPARSGIAGFLYIDSKSVTAAIDPKLTEFVVALSRLVGTAVENAQLFDEQRYRRRLLGALVHDLRTPLAVVLANLSMMQGALKSGEDADDMIVDIEAGCRRMGHMVANTLELSLGDDGWPRAEPARVNLREALTQHLETLRVVARGHNLGLTLSAEPHIGRLSTVPSYVWIVVDNLVFLAIRHAAENSTLRILMTEQGDAGPDLAAPPNGLNDHGEPIRPALGTQYLRIALHCPGEPVSRATVHRMFDQFDGPIGRGQAVGGMGLAIVRQCLRYLGGHFWVDADAEGSVFSFTLPIEVRSRVRRNTPNLSMTPSMEFLASQPTL